MQSRLLTIVGAKACALAMLTIALTGVAIAKERVEQIPEDSARIRTLPAQLSRSVLNVNSADRVCEAGAKWIRLDFRSLQLRAYDSLVLKSSGGDRYVFQGGRWNDRAFSARALRGSCVEIQPYFASPNSAYQLRSYSFGTRALATTTVTVAGAGDICDTDSATCKATSDLIVQINPDAVFTAGDNAYNSGTLSEYNARYKPTWGRFRELTYPSPGNHDYRETTDASGYFDYFNGVLTGTGADRAKGYYSWDVGDWHFIALNTMNGDDISSTQLNWLRDDLAANTKPCTAAYFHHPLISFGHYAPSGSAYSYETVKPLYDWLYAAKADLVLVGHDHNYQRFVKMNASLQPAADGFVQVLVGTGGRSFYDVADRTSSLLAPSAYSASQKAVSGSTHGVLKLTLNASGYAGEFVRATYSGNGDFGSATRPERFTGTCNKAGSAGNVAPVANFTSASSGLTATFTDTSTDSDGTIASRSWSFGDGTSSTTTNPSKTYATDGTYTVKLTVTDNGGASNTVSKSVTVSGGSIPSQLLLNPGFESGAVSWTATTGVIRNDTSRTPRTGSYYAWLNGYGSTTTETLSQRVTIPSGKTSATLGFYLKIDTEETTSTDAYDTLKVQVLNASGAVLKTCATYSNLNASSSYVLKTCDLSAYLGQTVTIKFTGIEDDSLQTSFVIDDSALNVK